MTTQPTLHRLAYFSAAHWKSSQIERECEDRGCSAPDGAAAAVPFTTHEVDPFTDELEEEYSDDVRAYVLAREEVLRICERLRSHVT